MNDSTTSIRIPARTGYTVIPNGVLPEGQISARAWGVYAYLLSRPPGWIARVNQLRQVFREGRDALYGAIRELCEVGLIAKVSVMDDAGMPRYQFVLVTEDMSQPVPNPDSPEPGNPGPGNPDPSHYRPVVTTDNSHRVEQPSLDVGLDSTTCSPSGEEKRKTDLEELCRFDEFWSVYPRRTGKGQARTAWAKAIRKTTVDVILKGAMRYRDDPNREQAYTKHPSTWLNSEGWDDDPIPPKGGPQLPANGYWPTPDGDGGMVAAGSSYWPA